MTPRERRERLFKNGRPNLRPLKIYDGGKYSKDVALLWVAHQKRPFVWMGEVTQEAFAEKLEHLAEKEDLMVSEDIADNFKEGKGMVALFDIVNDGWKFEPHVQFMPWASKRQILRNVVGFLQFIRNSRKVGSCVVYSLKDSVPLFEKCCEYGVLRKVGFIQNGDPRGDEYVYAIRGKRVNKG